MTQNVGVTCYFVFFLTNGLRFLNSTLFRLFSVHDIRVSVIKLWVLFMFDCVLFYFFSHYSEVESSSACGVLSPYGGIHFINRVLKNNVMMSQS